MRGVSVPQQDVAKSEVPPPGRGFQGTLFSIPQLGAGDGGIATTAEAWVPRRFKEKTHPAQEHPGCPPWTTNGRHRNFYFALYMVYMLTNPSQSLVFVLS